MRFRWFGEIGPRDQIATKLTGREADCLAGAGHLILARHVGLEAGGGSGRKVDCNAWEAAFFWSSIPKMSLALHRAGVPDHHLSANRSADQEPVAG